MKRQLARLIFFILYLSLLTTQWVHATDNGLVGSTGNVPLSAAAATIYRGDCDYNGTVTIDEVQSAINMFLGSKAVAGCVTAENENSVSIADVQAVINGFLGVGVPMDSGKYHVPDLQKIPGLFAKVSGQFTFRTTDAFGTVSDSSSSSSVDIMVYEPGTNSSMPITWNGTAFTGKREFGAEQPGGMYRLDEISGTVSADGATLLNGTYTYRSYSSNSAENGSSVTTQKITLQNVPLWTTGPAEHTESGAAIQKYITTLERSEKSYRDGNITRQSELIGVEWSGAQLFVKFRAFAMDF